jgi:hypothetical protein
MRKVDPRADTFIVSCLGAGYYTPTRLLRTRKSEAATTVLLSSLRTHARTNQDIGSTTIPGIIPLSSRYVNKTLWF